MFGRAPDDPVGVPGQHAIYERIRGGQLVELVSAQELIVEVLYL